MKAVNIYILTRVNNPETAQQLERQLSGRSKMLKVKEWEMRGLRRFSDSLSEKMEDSEKLCFFYSFVMPKLGKEYDLLRISDKSVINIELKSGNITDEAIRKQLLQNQYYLSTLGKEIYSYTFISGENRLVKLTNSDRIQEVDWGQLIQNLKSQENCYTGDIEELFKEEQYLISPLSDPEHFLRREYFLTSQQYDIKKRILKNITENAYCYQGFTGLPGTGKSILLYDIAMELSQKKKICMVHLGTRSPEMDMINERLKRIDFLHFQPEDEILFTEKYGAILVDEGHWMSEVNLKGICDYAEREQIPVLITYDREDALSEEEGWKEGVDQIEELPGYIKYQLTNRIRVNSEISSFVYHMMKNGREVHRSYYPSVKIAYADTEQEAKVILQYYSREGYQYIRDEKLISQISLNEKEEDISIARCIEYDRVVMLMDESFWYDSARNLRSVSGCQSGESAVRCLYHGLNRAKKEIALVVLKNEKVFQSLMDILQKI